MIWIGVDAHKQLHQASALGEEGIAGERRIKNTPDEWLGLLAWARQWPERVWAIEGAWYLGRGLAQFLAEQGEEVHIQPITGSWSIRPESPSVLVLFFRLARTVSSRVNLMRGKPRERSLPLRSEQETKVFTLFDAECNR